MAHDRNARKQVRTNYVQGMALTSAAELSGIAYNTVRNWKRQDAAQGDDWDVARNARHMTKSGIAEMANQVLGELAEQFVTTLAALKNDKNLSSASRAQILVQLMDGYNKAIGAASRAMPNANRLAVAMDVLRFLSEFIGANFPAQRAAFLEIAESAGDDLVREFGGSGA